MLEEEIQSQMVHAAKSGDARRLSLLRMLSSAIHNGEIAKRTKLAQSGKPREPLTEEEILDVVMTEAKKRKEAIALYEKGGRQDLAEKEKEELSLLEKFLPPQFSEAEIKEKITAAIRSTGASSKVDLGKVMAALREELKGRADLSQVSKLVGEALEKGV